MLSTNWEQLKTLVIKALLAQQCNQSHALQPNVLIVVRSRDSLTNCAKGGRCLPHNDCFIYTSYIWWWVSMLSVWIGMEHHICIYIFIFILADTPIQSNILTHAFFSPYCSSMGIKPTTVAMQTPCSINWATQDLYISADCSGQGTVRSLEPEYFVLRRRKE